MLKYVMATLVFLGFVIVATITISLVAYFTGPIGMVIFMLVIMGIAGVYMIVSSWDSEKERQEWRHKSSQL